MQIDARCNVITGEIIGAALEIHRALGPGLLESPYVNCLRYELSQRRLRFASEVGVPLTYKGQELGYSYRVDLIVENLVIVEVKAVESVLAVHKAQTLTYMKLAACPLGLLINFNEARLIDGVHRLINPA